MSPLYVSEKLKSAASLLRIRVEVWLNEFASERRAVLVLSIVLAPERKYFFFEPVSWFWPVWLAHKVRAALAALVDQQFLDMVRREEVLVIARWDAVEIEEELLVTEALIEAHKCDVFLGRLNMLHLVILVHLIWHEHTLGFD